MARPSDSDIIKVATTSLDPLPNMFELALVLGGTVSAGAYTAGVLDFLVQAMDCWSAARAAGQKVPRHKVALRVVAGTSGGGVNAAVLARALAYNFPHFSADSAMDAGGSGNPFFDTWTAQIHGAGGATGLRAMLETSDLASTVPSLLSGAPIDNAAAFAAAFARGSPVRRDWVGRPLGASAERIDPLHVILTVTNLRGVPYRTDFGDGLFQTFVDHADHVRVGVCYPGMAFDALRPDEWALGFAPLGAARETDWTDFSLFARATSAFPLGLPARMLTRPVADYYYRVALVPQEDGTMSVVPLRPDWSEIPEDPYQFACVDGGATDNEPIELARTALSGVLGRNPRGGKEANRAVLLVDPFAGAAPLGPERAGSMIALAGGLVTGMIQQTRYDSSDLLLAAAPDVYSRFMVTARRESIDKTLTGGDAIASAGLGAFVGFACADFMRHDFLLGRKNCQDFLRATFVLPEDADVFQGMWTGVDASRFRAFAPPGFLPLIPLYGDADADQGVAPWPVNALDPATLREPIRARVARIAEIEADTGFAGALKGWLAGGLAAGPVADYAVNAIDKALRTAADPLLRTAPPAATTVASAGNSGAG
ncbi:MAG TPA: patatin-like phospholipase family protein [Acetobacteraceae bacterium]|nr:patatin-like phospholipase family protein [Acetobacteraceae bacterium]